MKRHLLVVDDNEANRDMLAQRLIRKGYEVETAESGLEALGLIDDKAFDLVLLDIMMPGMSGIEVLARLRESYTTRDLPIIMATANDSTESVVQALELGANDYITKPIDFPVALARVESHLRQKAARLEQPEEQPKEGSVLAGKYRLGEPLGAGSYGTVFRAMHLELETEVALKVLHDSGTFATEALARFRREGISACRVRHPNAVSVLDFGVTEGHIAYMVMELLEGRSLQEELAAEGPMKPQRCLEILRPVCSMLGEAHDEGLVHRDIKPANVFLHHSRSEETVKVLDFGIAKLINDANPDNQLTGEGRIVGSPAYMAPERFNSDSFDGRADVYSVGVMLFQMLVGRLPFVSKELMSIAMLHLGEAPPSIHELNPSVPLEIDAVVQLALAKHPSERPSARELAKTFQEVLASTPAHQRA